MKMRMIPVVLSLLSCAIWTGAAVHDPGRELRQHLRGTRWQWNGGGGEIVVFGDIGYIEHEGWARRGLITRWDVVDTRTVLLRVERGRAHDLYAVLTFNDDLSSYDGFNFHGGARLQTSVRLNSDRVGRNRKAMLEEPVSPRATLDPQSLTNGLVVFYSFNGNAGDESGNQHDAIVNGAKLTSDRNGNPAAAYSFDGNDWIANETLSRTCITALSVCAWIKTCNRTHSYDGYAVVEGPGVTYMSRKSTSVASPQLGCIMSALDSDSINNQEGDFADIPINDSEWHFIAAVNDGSTTQVYVDGKRGVTYDENATCAFSGITIGRIAAGRAYWIGEIDDIRVYDRALSTAEIVMLKGIDD